MPNCFTLTRKGETTPANLNAIDEELCTLLGVPVHPTKYVEYWFDIIGLPLACGKSLEEIIKRFKEDNEYSKKDNDQDPLVKIAEYLNEHYVSNAWCER